MFRSILPLLFAASLFVAANPLAAQYHPYQKRENQTLEQSNKSESPAAAPQKTEESAPAAASSAEQKSVPAPVAPSPFGNESFPLPTQPNVHESGQRPDETAKKDGGGASLPLPTLEEVVAEKALIEKLKPGEEEERTYYPTRNAPDSLAARFMALLPPSMKGETRWKVDAEKKSLTITGPSQVIATADQLIPRMDANLQLAEGMIDYGLAAPETVPAKLPESASKPSEPYYDPNENRIVRTLFEPDGAILPNDGPERGVTVLGEDRASAPTGEEASETPDVVVYECAPQTIAVTVAKLKTRFASSPEIMITSDPARGKILVYATRRSQEEIEAYLAPFGLAPQVHTAAAETKAAPAVKAKETAATAPSPKEAAPQPTQCDYSPVYKNLSDLEKELSTLFQSRMEKIFPNDASDPNLTPAEREKSIWRFTRRKRDGETRPAAGCELAFHPREQKILITGDAAVVGQMKTLIESMDKSAESGANRPHYILLRNVDPNKIRDIFRVERGETPGDGALIRRTPNVRRLESAERGKENGKENGSESGADPIRPVNYQEASLGDLGDAAGLGDAGSFGDAGMGASNGPSGRGQLDLVPDFVPMVLPDLDMVILDAPEAEAKRIIDMIREIERLALEADPKTEIYYLKHVNSVMLGGVLQKLYAEMFATKQGRVMAYSMQYPNAILLVGWGQALDAMKNLIDTFDQPIESGGSTIRVISLKYASANETARMLTTYFPSPDPETGGFAPRIRAIPDPRTNSLIIQAAPNDFEEIQKVLMDLDVNRSETRLQVKTFKLKNSLAEDLRATISNAIIPATQGTVPAAEAKYPILEILTVDAESKKLIESGIMRDVQISADVFNNQLIITAPSDCMDLLSKLVEMLDVEASKAYLKIFPVRYGDATQMQKVLMSVLPTGGGSMPSIPNAEGENSFVPLKFSVDTRTNSILAAGSQKDLKVVDALILSLDREDTTGREQDVIGLRNVRADAIAAAINKYLAEKQRLELSSESISDSQLFESQVIVVPEPDTNSIIVSATSKYLEDIRKLIKLFDSEPAQVVIQVLIAEVTLTDDEEFGIEAGLQDSVAFDRSLVTSTTNGVNSTTGNPGYDFISNNSQGNNYSSSTDPSDIAGQVLNNFNMGRTSSDLGYGGLVLSASSQSVQVLLRALREKNRLQILSRPQIMAMDNMQGFILIGQRVPRVSGASTTNYAVTSNITEANVGLILLVTPRISDDGRIIMEIGAEKSSLGGEKDAIPVFTSGTNVITSPSIDTTQVMTAVSAVNGETVMLGGLISTSKEKISRGVPYISDIPVLGWLFRYDRMSEERKELIIVMTPRVIQRPEDAEQIKRVEASKLSWCLKDAMEINGNMGLYDPLGGGRKPAKTKLLPFLDVDRMEEIPPSALRPAIHGKDYPATGVESGTALQNSEWIVNQGVPTHEK